MKRQRKKDIFSYITFKPNSLRVIKLFLNIKINLKITNIFFMH